MPCITLNTKNDSVVHKDKKLTKEELDEQSIKENTIRLSIGTEHIDDIIADLENGFTAVKE